MKWTLWGLLPPMKIVLIPPAVPTHILESSPLSSPSTTPPFTVEFQDQMAVVTIYPSLTDASWADISQAGDDIASQLTPVQKPRCLIDLSRLTYMGSSTVALIVRLWKGVQAQEGRSAVMTAHPVVTQVITLAGLNKVWSIVETREEAIDALGLGVPPETRLSSSGSLLTLAVVGTLMAIIGTVLREFGKSLIEGPDILTFIGAAIGISLGICSLVRDQSVRRYVGLLCVIISVALGTLSIPGVRNSLPDAPHPPATPTTPPATESDTTESDTPESDTTDPPSNEAPTTPEREPGASVSEPTTTEPSSTKGTSTESPAPESPAPETPAPDAPVAS